MKKKLLIATGVLITTVSLSYAFYNFGFANGTENGSKIGYEDGHSDGVKMGIEHVSKVEYTKGFEEGYQKGKAEVPNGYIKLTDCVPLEDICAKFIDEYDYQCLIIGDYGKQLDDPNNTSYDVVLSEIPDETEEYRNNMVNMSEVTDFEATETGLYLYMENGDSYYWER